MKEGRKGDELKVERHEKMMLVETSGLNRLHEKENCNFSLTMDKTINLFSYGRRIEHWGIIV
mgnify:CR=1 FL=1